jgi:hypothetical protein
MIRNDKIHEDFNINKFIKKQKKDVAMYKKCYGFGVHDNDIGFAFECIVYARAINGVLDDLQKYMTDGVMIDGSKP